MATTPTDRQTALARRIRVDIDTATYPTSSYAMLVGMQELKPNPGKLRTESDESYDDAGADRKAVTGYSWSLEGKLLHSKDSAGTSLNAVHAFLKTKFNAAKTTSALAGEFGVRWYDRAGLGSDGSYEGRAIVAEWNPEGGDAGKLDVINFTIQGQGPLAEITNPAASLVPVITSLSPTGGGTAGGTMVNIYGVNFTGMSGAAAVKFGVNNATSYMRVADNHIVAVAPAGSAATIQVSVTTPAGTSSNTAADDYTYA